MQTHELISRIEAIGLRLRVEGQRLWVSPRERLTPELIDELKLHKSELIELLAADDRFEAPSRAVSELFEWVGRLVAYPAGQGRLVSVNHLWAAVVTEARPDALVVILPSEVTDPDDGRPLVTYRPGVN